MKTWQIVAAIILIPLVVFALFKNWLTALAPASLQKYLPLLLALGVLGYKATAVHVAPVCVAFHPLTC